MTSRFKYLFLILILIFTISACDSNSTVESLIEKDDSFDKFCKSNNFNGSILVVDDGEIVLKKGYGFADYEKKIPNTPDTIFGIASLTKQFTAVGIMMLNERGALNVSDTIDKYIPGYPNGDKITIHNLLTNTSGIAEYINEELLKGTKHYSPTNLINVFKDKPLNFNPGERFEYSNSNYALLGYIIEKVSNMKYEDFVKENIFIPLKMKDTGYDHNKELPKKAIRYKYLNAVMYAKADYINMSTAYSAGALQSTIEDLYRWDQALYTNKLLDKESMNKMFTPFLDSYGYGWFIIKPGKKPIMQHMGTIDGVRALIYRNVELKQTIIILSNNTATDRIKIKDKIMSLLGN